MHGDPPPPSPSAALPPPRASIAGGAPARATADDPPHAPPRVARQRERVETERKKSRDLLDSAIEAMSDGFVMWDEQDRLLACNHRFREIYALSAPFIHPGARFEDIIREGAKIGQYPQAGDDIEQFVR